MIGGMIVGVSLRVDAASGFLWLCSFWIGVAFDDG